MSIIQDFLTWTEYDERDSGEMLTLGDNGTDSSGSGVTDTDGQNQLVSSVRLNRDHKGARF